MKPSTGNFDAQEFQCIITTAQASLFERLIKRATETINHP